MCGCKGTPKSTLTAIFGENYMTYSFEPDTMTTIVKNPNTTVYTKIISNLGNKYIFNMDLVYAVISESEIPAFQKRGFCSPMLQ